MVDDKVKRMHYYNGLFLMEEDFRTEQKYNIQMRRLVNWYLNKAHGVLVGLHVKPAWDKYYKVTPGIAISNSGEEKWFGTEIILRSEQILNFSQEDPKEYYVTIKYDEHLGDVHPEQGQYPIHWIEDPEINIRSELPNNTETEIILAKVIVPPDKDWISNEKYVETDERQEIGPALRPINDKVGIGTSSPTEKLEVNGTVKATKFVGDGSGLIKASRWNDVPGGIAYNDGKVGIGTDNPQYDLDVSARTIKLGLEKAGGGQLIIKNNPNDDEIYLEAFGSINGSAKALHITGADNLVSLPALILKADRTYIDGDLDVTAHGIKLGLEKNGGGSLYIVNNPNDKGIYLEACGSADTLGNAAFLTICGNSIRNVPMLNIGADTTNFNGNVGIGTNPENSEGWSKVLDICGNSNAKLSVRTPNIDARVLSHEIGWWGAPAGMTVGTSSAHPVSFGTHAISRMTIAKDGNVGIGTENPQYDLDVKASGIKLGLEKNGGGQLVITNNKDDNSIYLEALNSQGSGGSASAFVLSGIAGTNVPWLDARADNTVFRGNVGIGTINPTRPLVVRASGLEEELIGFEDSEGKTKWSLNQNHDDKSGLNFVETGVADGRLFIKAGGNVGIGTTDPSAKLEVNGKIKGKADLTIDGKVGIGTDNPQYDLDVSARTIKLGLEKAGGGQLIIKNNPNDDEIYLEAFSSINGSAKALHITGADNLVSLPALILKADRTYIDGDLDVTAHGIKLGLEKNGGGSLYIVNNPNDKGIYLEACGSADDLGNAAFLTICGNSVRNVPTLNLGANNTNLSGNINVPGTITGNQNLFVQGNVGIGTTAPEAGLHIDKGNTNDLALKLSSNGPGWGSGIQFKNNDNMYGIYAGSGQLKICDANKQVNRLIIDDSGNVGIGTDKPDGKLDVKGSVYAGNSDIYFTNTEHTHTGIGNTPGYAAIENAKDYGALMILGRESADKSVRIVRMYDDVYISNTLNAQTKNFLINHPLNPDTHDLVHSTLEGPEIAVFYRGEDETSNGEVTVTLPSYFEDLTRKENRTVLLTPKIENDESEISMLAASEVKDGKFKVKVIDYKNISEKGSRLKHQRFYWEVKAIRADVKVLEVEPLKLQQMK